MAHEKGILQEVECLKQSLNIFQFCTFNNFVSALWDTPHTNKNMKHKQIQSRASNGLKNILKA